ncbi:pancreatic triacylglycerol lipase isoform X1 [Apis florea]|uniref:pancreatic triacylglycerol lipase isoform X1 n=1 Tax=Apis florea TaxID=7463 RepID=UPI0012FF0350|nr:pancreatic triacylglycerol lipase isoform X1 [Apis florea]
MINIYFYCFFAFFNFLLTVTADVTQNVFLRLYNRNGSYIDENIRNASLFLPHIQKNNFLIIFINGFTNDINSLSDKLITSAYLDTTQDNVFALDYRNITTQFYPFAVADIPTVGKCVADALNIMIENGVNPKKIHIIGHSLGAELGGSIGRQMKFRIGRITGLDPAGPLFYFLNSHLKSSDARFVGIIHADIGGYGLALKTGDVDFFPNYGHRPQPNCPLIGPLLSQMDLCSHSRSFEFYAESVRNHTAFIAKCYSLNECGGVEYIPMGYATSVNSTGTYYLLTNTESPFGRGLAGATFDPLKIIPIPVAN